MLTPQKIQTLKKSLPTLKPTEKREVLNLLEEYERRKTQQEAQKDLLKFAGQVYPGYKVGPHHRRLAKIFEEIAIGNKKRVIVNIAPRHGKSELISHLAPAWFLGKYPHKK